VKRIRPVIRTGERNKSVLADQVTRFFYNEADQLVREETDLLALTNGTNKGKLATELTYDSLIEFQEKSLKKSLWEKSQLKMTQTSLTHDNLMSQDLQVQITKQ
jgi:hypothetical protein